MLSYTLLAMFSVQMEPQLYKREKQREKYIQQDWFGVYVSDLIPIIRLKVSV